MEAAFAAGRNRRTRVTRVAVVTIALLSIVVTAAWTVFIVRSVHDTVEWFFFTPPPQRPFERDRWLRSQPWSGRNGHNNTRWSMVEDLRKRHLHPGMTRQQVERLLGRPDRVRQADLFRYTIGDDGGAHDPALLTLFFDDQGRLKVARAEW